MKKTWFAVIAALLMMTIAACEDNSNVDDIDAARQEKILREAQRETGLPDIHNFQEKKNLKTIYELRDKAKIGTYTYTYSAMSGKLMYFGRSIGYGIPYATQYSNPEKEIWSNPGHANGHWIKLPQAEPNGLFMPGSAHGTWIMVMKTDGSVAPGYFEPDVVVLPFKVEDVMK